MSAETNTEAEPSIEEILESIRQIISEEDEEEVEEADIVLQQEEEPAPHESDLTLKGEEPEAPIEAAPPPPAEETTDNDPVLDLTDKVEDIPASDLDLSVQQDDTLVSDQIASASAAEMAKLLQNNLSVERELPGRPGQVTLEDISRELMRPLIKEWLDKNLQSIIEKMVRKEIERISHRALGGE